MTASAEDVLAVHEELLTLVRAGLPLDRGLRALANDLPGRMRPLLSELTARLERGQDVVEALAEIPSPAARAYAAVLALGIRTGRPAEALEGIIGTARRAGDFRKSLVAELVYPLLVTIVGVVLIAFSLVHIAPVEVAVSEHFGAGGPIVSGVKQARLTPSLSWILVAITSVIALGLFVMVPRWVGASPLQPAEYWRPLRQIRLWQSTALLCDLLALLLDNQVPLPQSLQLASEATPWPPLARAVHALAQRVAQGETTLAVEWPLSPTVGWLFQRPSDAGLTAALRREAEHCRRQTERLQNWFSLYFPSLVTLVVGTTCLAVLALINLAPLVNLYYYLSHYSP